MSIELLLTFFFVLAMYATAEKAAAPWMSGGVLAAAILFAGPLTGGCLNPARWIGPAFWEMLNGGGASVGRQALIYMAGPVIGALLAGAFASRIYLPARQDSGPIAPM
jgi:glycerol uptake facilitator protein